MRRLRRWWLGLVLVAALLSCQRRGDPDALRIGFLLNLTHAQALVGAQDGTFARAARVPVELKPFNAGPPAMEALLSGDLDMAYVGAAPAVLAYVRSQGGIRVIAGAMSGGAGLVVKEAERPADLRGRRLAAPQIGNTQDVALRHYLAEHGLDASDRPGRDVVVLPLANSEILALFRRSQLDGAWVPEPWLSRLEIEGGGRLLVDERSLWPGGVLPTTVLIVTEKALRQKRPQIEAIVRAHAELTERWRTSPARFQDSANQAFARYIGKPLPPEILHSAFSRLEPTLDPMRPQLEEIARRMQALGYLPEADLTGLVDTSLLEEVRLPVRW